MGIQDIRSAAYSGAPPGHAGIGHKPHHTHSAASGGGVPVSDNPAYDIKHPNFCPQCGEALTPANFHGGAQALPDGPLGNIEMPPSGGPATTGISEMMGSPAMGAASHAKKKAKKAKSKSKPTPKKGSSNG